MDKLWAPWRMQYISTIDEKKNEGCIFCDKPKENKDAENLILHRSKTCFLIMNRFPYNNGHVMVVPCKHVASMQELSDNEKLDLCSMLDFSLEKLKSVLHPDGFNIGINMGRVAGAGVEGHIHIHVVPRWNGDTNFMPILAEAKIISESLREGYKRLSHAIRDGQ